MAVNLPRIGWTNNNPPAINANNLNKMEDNVEDAINELATDINGITIFNNAVQTITNNISNKVNFNTLRFKVGTKINHDSANNGIKFLKSGLVYITTKICLSSGFTEGQQIYLNFRKNNNITLNKYEIRAGATGEQHVNFGILANINKNDIVYIDIINYSTNQIRIGYNSTIDTYQTNELSAFYI